MREQTAFGVVERETGLVAGGFNAQNYMGRDFSLRRACALEKLGLADRMRAFLILTAIF